MLANALVNVTKETQKPEFVDSAIMPKTPMTGLISRVTLSAFLYKEAGSTPTLLLSARNVILRFNREAENLIGINVEMCGTVKLNQYIFRFEESLSKCIADIHERGEQENQKGELSPEFITYISTSLGKIKRVKLAFEEISYNNQSTMLVFLKPLDDFSVKADRFFNLMTNFMTTRVKDLPNMQLFMNYAATTHSAIGAGEKNRE
jgi:hypothetical protein